MKNAAMAQVVEHILGKDEVGSSSLPSSSKEKALALQVLFLLLGASHGVVVCSVSFATAFGCLSLTMQLLLFRKNHARLACSVVNALTTACCRNRLLLICGQPLRLSLRSE